LGRGVAPVITRAIAGSTLARSDILAVASLVSAQMRLVTLPRVVDVAEVVSGALLGSRTDASSAVWRLTLRVDAVLNLVTS
jgi:hypothetical protein